ncbi:MAG: low molecular weight phosphatase family protein [Rhodospirillales bacterium]|nr:low molecular weight phosphatase family protein [Alphaproteobacteria bacterium]MCB9987270.1 low molecular weight phosphatase family protein [Rhodospirillales bacterium]USO07873.1 MAG: low molecular weight phosphatase family protein [Rhodospirillales bacterium]
MVDLAPPVSVLFLCDRNAVRSPMAAALLSGAHSAGLDPAPYVDPFACTVTLEIGVDITAHEPRAVDFAAIAPATQVIALSPAAFAAAHEWRLKTGFELETWDLPAIPDPEGPREHTLAGYRALRDALRAHIANRFGGKT